MFDAYRFRSLLTARGLSQSELARRVGVSQASIYRLAAGDAYGSKHLHKIARVLETSPGYLTGETDDPAGDAPAMPVLDSETRELNEKFAMMSQADRRALLQIARSIVGVPPNRATLHDQSVGYRQEEPQS